MNGEPLEAKATKTFFVYNRQTGKVVHIHQFIPYRSGVASPDREMEEMALKMAPTAFDRNQLSVFHDEKELDIKPDNQYRVDLKNNALIVEPAPPQWTQESRRIN